MTRQRVGIAELRVGGPGGVLFAVGLGSCVAVAIHDPARRRGSLAHIMLPQRTSGNSRPDENLNKYADVAIRAAVKALELQGSRRSDLAAKIAGGASMFDLGRADQPDVGRRNVEAVVRHLAQEGIPLRASDVGGSQGRTVEFRIDTGELVVRTIRGTPRSL